MKFLQKFKSLARAIYHILVRLDNIQLALGRIELRQLEVNKGQSFNSYEFKVFSQWGDDGLIQYLINTVPIEKKIFIEFGVENFTESNCRFLLQNNNWAGMVIDGSASNIDYIKQDEIYWKFNLKAEQNFIDKDNINFLIKKNGIIGDVGILSIDIDGNDYWVWESLDIINPRIVICEYNSIWGKDLSITVPYDPNFNRTSAHYSNLYFGASIVALNNLAKSKGYALIGSNSSGNNLFFVRADLLNNLKVVYPEDTWIKSQFRESVDESGRLTHLSHEDGLVLLADMPLVNLEDNNQYSVRNLLLQT